MALGMPYLEKIFSLGNLIMTLASVVLVDIAFTHRHIVYGKENILIPKRIRKWSHRINSPNIKNLNSND